jgi:transcription antitermination protein NusB
MSSRHKSREFALRSLYNWEFHNDGDKALEELDFFPALDDSERDEVSTETVVTVHYLVTGTLENQSQIDKLINKYSTRRKVDKIELVDRCILRLAIFQMLFQKKVPTAVLIDEAVKLSLEYSSNVNYKLINGILDTIRKEEL